MGMRIPSSGAAQAPSQSSVAQWQQRRQQIESLPAAPSTPAPAKPTATHGNLLNVVA